MEIKMTDTQESHPTQLLPTMPMLAPGATGWLRDRVAAWQLSRSRRRTAAILASLDSQIRADLGAPPEGEKFGLPYLADYHPAAQISRLLSR
jgi:hypothetical protein